MAKVGRVVLFSGGNDSLATVHIVRNHVDAVAHIVTGIGILETTEFVKETCREWNLPLILLITPPEVYEEFIFKTNSNGRVMGFPGPSGHQAIYYYLKQRRVRELRKMFVKNYGDYVIFFTGIRSNESNRRMLSKMAVPVRKEGSIIWVNPILKWTINKRDNYLEINNVRLNPVTNNLHRSGECLCGAFAYSDELNEIEFFYPDIAKRIRNLEEKLTILGAKNCQWGGGGKKSKKIKVPGPLCFGCQQTGLNGIIK